MALSLIFLLLFLLGCIGVYAFYLYSMVEVSVLKKEHRYISIRGFFPCFTGLVSNTYIDPNKIPGFFTLILLLHEDDLFFEHQGANWVEIFARIKVYLFSGKRLAGGSSITQQLAKLVFTRAKRSFHRKFKELMIANKIERQFSKDEILGLYLSVILFGTKPHGLKAGCKHVFQKAPEDLSLEEAFILVAFIPCPMLMETYLLKNKDDSVFNYLTAFEKLREALRICQVSLGSSDLKDLMDLSYAQVKEIMQSYSRLNTHSLTDAQERNIAINAAEFVYQIKYRIEAAGQLAA